MINPMKYKYLVAIMTADKKAYDITQFVEDVSWEEGENQLAARISFTAKNDKTSKGRISSLAKPGCYAALLYSYNGGKNAEATRGKIVEWNPSARTSGEKFKVKAWNACSSVMIHSNVFRYFVTSNRIMIDKCYHKEVENVVFRYFWSNI